MESVSFLCKRPENLKKEVKEKHFLKTPEYKGGTKAMQKFLSKNRKYPATALEAGIEGTVSIRYTIGHKGNVIKTKILAGVGYGCDEEAIRVVSLLKFDVPKTRKIKAQYHKTVHLHFRLPQTPLPAAQMRVTYEMTPKRAEKPKEKDVVVKAPSYHYQINH